MNISELFESVLPKFDVAKYNPLLPNEHDKWLKATLSTFEQQLNAGKVYSPAFNDMKERWSRGFEKRLKELYDAEVARELYKIDYDIRSYISLNQATGQLKKVDAVLKGDRADAALKKQLEKAKVILQLGADLYKDLTALKPHLTPGRAPKPSDPNKFHNVVGGDEAVKLVTDGLKEEIKDQMDLYESAVRDYFLRLIADLIKADKYSTKERGGLFTDVYFKDLFDHKSSEAKSEKYGTHPWEVKRWREFTGLTEKAGAKKLAETEARKLRDDIEKKFLSKSVRKLSNIVEKKGNLKRIKVIHSKPPSHNVVEAAFNFLFDDSSTFDVNNKVVWKWATKSQESYGQYPTTFHNVKLPDGSKLGTPSEEKMVKVFTKGAQEK